MTFKMHLHKKCKKSKIKITHSILLYNETNLVFGQNCIALKEKKCKVIKILALIVTNAPWSMTNIKSCTRVVCTSTPSEIILGGKVCVIGNNHLKNV